MKKSKRKPGQGRIGRIVSNRILILSLAIVALFGVLFLRLLTLQAVEHSDYVEKKDDYTSIRQYTSAPRGQIYDVNGNVLAKTVVSHNIVYTSPNNMTYSDYMLYADRVGEVFDLSLDDFTSTELKDAYLTYTTLFDEDDPHYYGYDLISDKQYQQYLDGTLTSSQIRKYQLLKIDQDVLDSADQRTLKAAAIYNRMATSLSTGQAAVIAEDVSDADVAYLVEHKSDFPGFDIDFGGWKREYPYGECLSDVIGTVSTSTEGLPDSSAEYYLSKGYQYNAQVGKSGLEYQYNDILTGTDEIAKITYDSNGLARKEVLQAARKGNDIYLSIDIELQQTLDETLKSTLTELAGTANRENFYSLFMCMENPQNGDVLAMSGYIMDPETRQLSYFASGNYTYLVNPGSCVKGVTVYMGQSEGVVQEGEVIVDKVMNIGGEQFGSFEEHGPVSDIDALAVSSNVYMFNIAMRLGGDEYVEGEQLNIADPEGTLNLMRSYYSMFGLGSPTGLDVPSEAGSYLGGDNTAGLVLNYSIGQLDTYTPMQLLNYVSVVASSGNMYQPQLYQYSKEINGDEIFDLNETHLVSTLPEENASHLARVQQGFKACVETGNCSTALENMDVEMAAKTGTAEVGEWTTANLIGYGPFDNPTVAFACSAPTSSVNSSSVSSNVCGDRVVGPVLAKYFELYPQ